MNKKVVIGTLVAGVFLLPAVASAGKVSGRCDNCHTMHASQNDVTSAANATLLKGNGCVACHAEAAQDNNASGIGGTYNAPQVGGVSTAPGTYWLSGGYFAGTGSATQHNVAGVVAADATLGNNVPGSTTNMTSQLTCQGCHTGTGGHHGNAVAGYRMLGSAIGGTGLANYGSNNTLFAGARGGNDYVGANINTVCGNCHGDFHAANATDANIWNGTNFIRHPVNIPLTQVAARNTDNDYSAAIASAVNVTPISDDATPVVMCLSCHVAHGGPYADLLSFDYAGVSAGDNSRANGGCENCHNYGTNLGY